MSTKKSLQKNFWWRSWLTVAGITVLAVILSFLTIKQGPRIRLVRLEGQGSYINRLVFYTNRGLAPALPDLKTSLTPQLPFSTSLQSQSVTLSLHATLQAGTTYTVKIDGLVGSDGKAARPYEYRFTTPKATYAYIERNYQAEGDRKDSDSLKLKTVGAKTQTLFRAGRIKMYALTQNYIGVVTINPDNSERLTVVHRTKRHKKDAALPKDSIITGLDGSLTQDTLALSLVASDPSHTSASPTLMVLDIANNNFSAVAGLDDQPPQVLRLAYAPDGVSLLFQTYDTSLYLVDPLRGRSPLALGQYANFGGFSFDGSKLLLQKNGRSYELQADTRIVRELPAQLENASQLYFARNSSHVLGLATGFDGESLLVSQQISWSSTEDNSWRVLYEEPLVRGLLAKLSLSPDDILYSFEHAPAHSKYDDYNGNSKPMQAETRVVDLQTGRQLESVRGTDLKWL